MSFSGHVTFVLRCCLRGHCQSHSTRPKSSASKVSALALLWSYNTSRKRVQTLQTRLYNTIYNIQLTTFVRFEINIKHPNLLLSSKAGRKQGAKKSGSFASDWFQDFQRLPSIRNAHEGALAIKAPSNGTLHHLIFARYPMEGLVPGLPTAPDGSNASCFVSIRACSHKLAFSHRNHNILAHSHRK